MFPRLPTRSDTGLIPRGLNFRIKKVEGLNYLCSENKDADLRLYVRICKKQIFS